MTSQTVAKRRTYTSEERAQYREGKRAEQRAAMERSVRALLSSEGWQAWAQMRATFHRYSWGNCALIAMQRPDATQVAGFKAWQQLGRQVRKGERSIKIMAPMSVKREDAETGEEERVVFFRAVPVFDLSQTDGPPLPEPPREPITGSSHEHYIGQLEEHARSLGFTVEREPLEHAGGYCDAKRRRIVVSSNVEAPNARVRILVHELAHAHGVGYADYGREDAEVVVETAAFVVCGALGLDTSGESVPYVAGWAEDGDLDAIRRHAETVDRIAGELEQACELLKGGGRDA
jgi:antirestriction protein ArdC